MLVLPVLSISFNNDNGSKTANGKSFRMSSATINGSLSAYGADIKKSILSDIDPILLEVSSIVALYEWHYRLPFSFTRMLSALRTVGGSSFKSISSISGRSRLSSWFACLASLDNGSAMVIVGPDFYNVSTIAVNSNVSWILHAEIFPMLLREAFFMPCEWSE